MGLDWGGVADGAGDVCQRSALFPADGTGVCRCGVDDDKVFMCDRICLNLNRVYLALLIQRKVKAQK